MTNGWIGVDLDGTLAVYNGWRGVEHIGDPVPLMLARVKEWVDAGVEVRIFTARVSGERGKDGDRAGMSVEDTRKIIEDWCQLHIGKVLPVTCVKDFGMIALYDDRCIQVEANTGILLLGRSSAGGSA